MRFSVAAVMLTCTWIAVLIAAITAVLKAPYGLVDLPPLLVGLMSFASLAFTSISAITIRNAVRPFCIGYLTAAVCFIAFLLIHEPDGPNHETAFRPISDLLFEKLNASHSSWISFHLANILEYWSIPPIGVLGGVIANRLVRNQPSSNN